ncbi:hypothetical protein [Methylobacter tundripaludum]|uniref:hypothetical protein n=1 Tax=Methylobacter tundripaludum TaxID=173365 RepID=UPI000AD70A69|nr:hypothetical protein [Methylobacter tundripaludum]
MLINTLNSFVFKYIRFIEMLGVLMRIFSFSLVSWMGPESPFLFVWAFNTTDAVILSWCSILKKDSAYTLLNVFWIMVGIVGMLRASQISLTDFKSVGLHFITQVMALVS